MNITPGNHRVTVNQTKLQLTNLNHLNVGERNGTWKRKERTNKERKKTFCFICQSFENTTKQTRAIYLHRGVSAERRPPQAKLKQPQSACVRAWLGGRVDVKRSQVKKLLSCSTSSTSLTSRSSDLFVCGPLLSSPFLSSRLHSFRKNHRSLAGSLPSLTFVSGYAWSSSNCPLTMCMLVQTVLR